MRWRVDWVRELKLLAKRFRIVGERGVRRAAVVNARSKGMHGSQLVDLCYYAVVW